MSSFYSIIFWFSLYSTVDSHHNYAKENCDCFEYLNDVIMIKIRYFYTFEIGGDIVMKIQIHSSTIDGNVEFVHSQYSCILTSIQFLCPKKLSIIVIILE